MTPRFPIDRATHSPAAQAAYDQVATSAGTVSPLYQLLLASPATAVKAHDLSTQLWNCGLPKSLLEALFLVVSKKFNCQEQWRRHHPKAIAAGVAPDDLEAIAQAALPAEASPLRAAVDVASRLLAGQTIPDALWQTALARHGKEGMANFCAFLGLASMVAMSINLQEDGAGAA